MSSAKFNEGTKVYQAFEIISDHEWHCGRCEFPTTHTGGLIREIVHAGFPVEKKMMVCQRCQGTYYHRRLKREVEAI